MPKIEMDIECPECNGTGLYQGMAEGNGTAVICYNCDGSGKYHFAKEYEEFTGLKKRNNIERVYLSSMGYFIGLGKRRYDGIGIIDMDKEGISYQEFLQGQKPPHIKTLGCPMLADQGACHDIKGFTEKCNKLNDGWISFIPNCKNRHRMAECWERFEKGEIK